jgi:hypothetical protein
MILYLINMKERNCKVRVVFSLCQPWQGASCDPRGEQRRYQQGRHHLCRLRKWCCWREEGEPTMNARESHVSARCVWKNFQTWFPAKSRSKVPRVSLASPSAKNRALGEENLPRVLHSGKRGFPECRRVHGTRGREALREGPLPRVQHSGKRGTQKRKFCIWRRRQIEPFGKNLPRVSYTSTRGR